MTEHKGIPGTAEAGGFQPWYLMNLFSALLWPGVFAVLLQTYALKITGSAADTGLIMGIGGIGALLSPVFGNIADRYRAHRPLQILAWAIVATSIATLAFSVNEMVFLVAALCFGVGMAPAGMISTVYVVGAGLSQESESRAMGAFQRMYFVGSVLGGFMVAGLLRSGLSDTVMFLICAGIAVICLFLALFTTRHCRPRRRSRSTERGDGHTDRSRNVYARRPCQVGLRANGSGRLPQPCGFHCHCRSVHQLF